ncbi:MAG: hypothetical protein WAS49_06925 [Candidatus Dechloromonas phosphoritropha]|jgi:hypothetical protein
MIEISSLKEVFQTIATALSAIKTAKDLLPEGKEKKVAERAVEEAISAAKLAEVQAATALGYPLCRCAWPPTIMVVKVQGGRQSIYHCATCASDFLVGQDGKIKGPYSD